LDPRRWQCTAAPGPPHIAQGQIRQIHALASGRTRWGVRHHDTQFETKDGAIETVTPLLEKDGSWKVSGYFIK